MFQICISSNNFKLRAVRRHCCPEHHPSLFRHIRPVFTVLENDLPMTVHGPVSGDADIEIAICTSINERIETESRFKNRPPVHHHPWRPDIITPQKLQTVIFFDTHLSWSRQRRTTSCDQ